MFFAKRSKSRTLDNVMSGLATRARARDPGLVTVDDGYLTVLKKGPLLLKRLENLRACRSEIMSKTCARPISGPGDITNIGA